MLDYHQPFILLPNRVWRTWRGGAVLDAKSGAEAPDDGHFPEDWIGSATRAVNPGREHLEDEGIGTARDRAGRTYSMREIYESTPELSLGPDHVAAYGARPQLLVKLLDSAMRLHVQAHPSVDWARRHLNATSGKTEAWWILQTRAPDAHVFLGFQHPPTPDAWKRLIDAQDVDAMLACFEPISVRPGDVLLVDGGIPHAIGEGITMIEVQEPTDYVVRCEFAHGGFALPESARTMGLGLDRVLDMFDYTQYPADTIPARFGPRPAIVAESAEGRETALLARPQTDRFELRKIRTTGTHPVALDGRCSIAIVTEGTGVLRGDGVEVTLEPWTRVFLPAALDSVEISGRLTLARCLPPTPPR